MKNPFRRNRITDSDLAEYDKFVFDVAETSFKMRQEARELEQKREPEQYIR
jgi:hypothetical protein